MAGERERITGVYREWEEKKRGLYAQDNPGNVFIQSERDRRVQALLRDAECTITAETNIFEMGCGYGGIMLRFGALAGALENITGIDLQKERLSGAKNRNTALQVLCADAAAVPVKSGRFDLVIQYLLFSSILDGEIRRKAADEMVRLLKPGGWLLWWDMRYPSPWNKNVRSIGKTELKQLFPRSRIILKSATLLPPLARKAAAVSYAAGKMLEMIPFLRSHYLAMIRPEK